MDWSVLLTVVAVLACGTAASLGMCIWIGVRLIRHEPILPYSPHRVVPWGGGLVLLIVILYLLLPGLWIRALGQIRIDEKKGVGQPGHAAGQSGKAGQIRIDEKKSVGVENPIVTLVRNHPRWQDLTVAACAVIVVAPVVEEFVFRLVLLGWLEKREKSLWKSSGFRRFLRRLRPGSARFLHGLIPVLLVSLLFASLHYRAAGPELGPDVVVHALVSTSMAGMFTLASGAALLRLHAHATPVDFGLITAEFWRDIRLGILTFLTIALPIYVFQLLLQYFLQDVLGAEIAADPFTLVLFALVLGTLYYRTHRIVPSVVLHMCLNMTSLTIALLVPATG